VDSALSTLLVRVPRQSVEKKDEEEEEAGREGQVERGGEGAGTQGGEIGKIRANDDSHPDSFMPCLHALAVGEKKGRSDTAMIRQVTGGRPLLSLSVGCLVDRLAAFCLSQPQTGAGPRLRVARPRRQCSAVIGHGVTSCS